ncbi:hypothetical protein [Paraburkholderia acidisoli]|uniref:hypothetical protein n=1 Tax=Paraburkholderia acidisoli TaxID=2571748 RepID=UPI0018EEDEC8|nr:hypothetical protein [Paraburkholderia acidisoli]
MTATIGSQKNRGNSRRCDTHIHATHIKVDFWRRYDRVMASRMWGAMALPGGAPPAQPLCGESYLSYRSRPAATIVLKMRSRRSLRSADGYVATDVEPRSAADAVFCIEGSGAAETSQSHKH